MILLMEISKDISRQILLFVALVIFAVLVVSSVAYLISTPVVVPDGSSVTGNQNEVNGCTLDARACPDGSFVGRNPQNNCNFDACPIESNNEPVFSCCDQNDWYNCKTPTMEDEGVKACEAGGCAACQENLDTDIPVNPDVSVSDELNAPVTCAAGTASCANGAKVRRKVGFGCAFAKCNDGSIPIID